MKTRTRRFKVVSFLVLLTMIVSLFGPMGTMKKVLADDVIYPFYVYSGGQWYNGFKSEERIVDNIQEVVHSIGASLLSLEIESQPQDAFLSLGTDPLIIDKLIIETDPGSDYEIPTNIKTQSLVLDYDPSSGATYTFTGNLENLFMWGGKALLIGDIVSLNLCTRPPYATPNRVIPAGSKLEIKGNVTSASWNKRTEVIPETEFVPGYGEEEMKASIERCDSDSCYEEFFPGDFSLQGTIKKLTVKELFYDKELYTDFMLTKKEISDYTTNSSMTPIIMEGVLSNEIPEECIKAYSTSEWFGSHQDTKYKSYRVDYDGFSSSYVWRIVDYAEGIQVGIGQELEVGEDHLPQNVDLSNAHIEVWRTAIDGLILPEGVDLSSLQILCGKVTVRGNVDKLEASDCSEKFDPGFLNVNVQGNVQFLHISLVRYTTSINVDGVVSDGEILTGYSEDETDSKICKISKKVQSNSLIVDEGTIDKGVILTTCNSDNIIEFTTGATYPELEEAAGITDDNRVYDDNGMVCHKYVGMFFSQHTISTDLIQSITDEANLDAGFQVTNQALNIKIKSFSTDEWVFRDGEYITSTPTEIPFSIVIPDYKEGAKYGIVRVHDNGDGTTSYDVLPTSVLNGVISFSSNKFSDFVLIKNDSGNDLTAPSISNNYQKDDTSMEVTVADNESGVDAVSYTVANGTAQTAVLTNGKFTIPSLEEGRYNVVVTAKDKAGNSSSQTIQVVSLHTVSFYYDEFSSMPPFATETIEYGNDATAPTVAKRPGFDFVGWNKSFTKVVSDIDVDALWNLTGVTVTPYVGTYDGKSHDMISIAGLNPSDVVTYSVDGEDYVTDCPSLTNVGSHSVYVKIDRDGLDTWISPEYTVTVARKAITLAMISEIPTVEFNGEHFCPVPVVKDGAITLKNGTDYTLSYTNNRNSGTAFVNVVGKGNYAKTVRAPFQISEKKSEVKVKDKETPEVVVPNLSKLYEDETIYTPEDRQIEENGGSVKVELAVQTRVVSVPDQTKIKEMAKDKKIGLFLDISLFKVVQQAGETSGSTSQISHTNQLLSIVIPIPADLKGRKGIELYRVHNGVPSIIPLGAENAIDGEYCKIDSENITLYVQNFSTYAIGYSTSSITSPKTGEESSQLPWILLGLGLAAAGVVVLKKSRRVRISK